MAKSKKCVQIQRLYIPERRSRSRINQTTTKNPAKAIEKEFRRNENKSYKKKKPLSCVPDLRRLLVALIRTHANTQIFSYVQLSRLYSTLSDPVRKKFSSKACNYTSVVYLKLLATP